MNNGRSPPTVSKVMTDELLRGLVSPSSVSVSADRNGIARSIKAQRASGRSDGYARGLDGFSLIEPAGDMHTEDEIYASFLWAIDFVDRGLRELSGVTPSA